MPPERFSSLLSQSVAPFDERLRALPLRWHLALVIGATLLPVVLFSGWTVLRLATQMRVTQEYQLLHAAKTMSLAFDREISSTLRTLQALAGSEALDRDDLSAFQAYAERVQRTQASWLTVLLISPDGEKRVQLGAEPGAATAHASVSEPESFRRILETREALVGDLAKGPKGRWAFPIRVPVLRGNEVRYVLTAVVTPEALEQIVADEKVRQPNEFARAITDSRGTVAFRTLNPELFVGKPAAPAFLERVRAREAEGVYRNITLEGAEAYVAFSRSALSGWYTAVVIPVEAMDAPFRRSVLLVVASGLLFILVGVGGGLSLSLRFRRGVRSVALGAKSLAQGERPQLESSGIAELDELNVALGHSDELLRQHVEEERRARTELEHAVKARDEFLSLASHELKTPLTSLALHARLFERSLVDGGSPPAESARRFIQQTLKQTMRLTRLVNDMLDISRIAAGRLSVEVETVDLAALARDVLERLKPQLQEAGCEVSLDASGPVQGKWDAYRLDQVLTNLLTNAARYAPGRPVEVSVRAVDGQAELRVRDHGSGIAADDQDRVFQKFERAVGGNKVSGLGLGLFIAREIVQMHGGSIRVTSEPGTGATFIVRLPLAAALQPSV